MHHIFHFHSNSEIAAITVIINTAHVHVEQVSYDSFPEYIPLTNIVSPTYNTLSGWVFVQTVYCTVFTSHEAQTGMCQCLAFCFFFFFCIVSNFNMMKTLTPLVHAGLFCCVHSPLNSDMGYRIFNLLMWSLCMHIHTGDLSLLSHPKDFCTVCTELDSREISVWAQNLAHNGQPAISWPC